MRNTIDRFIREKVKSGQYFDSHAVIAYIIQQNPDAYIQNVGNYTQTETYHGLHIASRMIKGFAGQNGLIEEVGDEKSISKNIKDEFTPCHLWRKL